MATVTKSIGLTGRDYSTLQLWETDLDDDTPYDAGDDAVGECYDDGDLIANALVFNLGGTLGLNSVKLTAASGHETDGTRASGVVIKADSGPIFVCDFGFPYTSEFSALEFSGNDSAVRYIVQNNQFAADYTSVKRCIFYQLAGTSNTANGIFGKATNSSTTTIVNCMFFDAYNANTGAVELSGVRDAVSTTATYLNCTVHNIDRTNATSDSAGCYGFLQISSTFNAKNCIATDVSNDRGTAPADCFESGVTQTTNLSSDATASGQPSKTTANQFVSTTLDSEDLKLKSGADAIDNGTDLTTTSDAHLDILSYDRDTGGVTWDIGAHEFIAAGGLSIPIAAYHYNHNTGSNL